MGMTEDPLKVFLGQLHPGTVKPHIEELLANYGHTAVDIFLPKVPPGQAQIAFLCFATHKQALDCIRCYQGVTDPYWTPSSLHAARANMRAYKILKTILVVFKLFLIWF